MAATRTPIRWHRSGGENEFFACVSFFEGQSGRFDDKVDLRAFFKYVRNERCFLAWSVWFVDRFQVVAACERVCAEGGIHVLRVSLRKCFGQLSEMVFALRCANSVRGTATTVCVSWCVHQKVPSVF